jgi:uncharacterized protein YqgC (DUF456 family)
MRLASMKRCTVYLRYRSQDKHLTKESVMKSLAITLLSAGTLASIWGTTYQQSHQAEMFGAIFGVTTGTYQLATAMVPVGILTGIIGLVLLIVCLKKTLATQ